MSAPDGGRAHVEAPLAREVVSGAVLDTALRRLAGEARAQATMPAWVGTGTVVRMERERRAELLELAEQLEDFPVPAPQAAEGVDATHDVARHLEAELRRALRSPELTARATPAWSAVGYDCPTVTIELPVAVADVLRERVCRRGRWTWLWRALGIVGR